MPVKCFLRLTPLNGNFFRQDPTLYELAVESDSDFAFTLLKEGGHQTKGEVFDILGKLVP